MSKSNALEQKAYAVEEKHRGEWIPLESKGPKGEKLGQKVVKITDEEAETMNIDSEKTRIRYVFKGKKDDGGGSDGNQTEKPLDKMTKTELEEKAKSLGVEFTEDHTNNEKRAAYLQSVIDANVNQE